MRFYFKDTDSQGILRVETIKNSQITTKEFNDFELNIGTERGSIFEVHSRIMKPGEVINSKLKSQDITRTVGNFNAKEYSLVFSSQQRRQLNMLKFYVVQVDATEAYVFHHEVAKYPFSSKFGNLVEIQMSESFVVTLHQRNQIGIFLQKNLKMVGARQQLVEIDMRAGIELIQ